MRTVQPRPTAIAAGVVVLLFGVVWTLSAWDLTLLSSFMAALAVTLAVGAGLYVYMPHRRERHSGSNRLTELLERSGDRRGIRDETTGLLSRWYLERRLDEEAARCVRYGHSMAVVVLKAIAIDLARFSIDSWQQESAAAANRAARVVRNVDLSAGLAPFEFALCLVHCDRTGAEAAIKRMVAEFREYDCRIGIAVYPEDECEPRALIELARVRMREYEAA